ncbi:hypothetical protein KUV23_12330 [Algoriphagus marincola]|uniref:Uncharacterized protein n=1 Tax=Algoriphagus marincola TaxID=264027 RepID=A0ABS7N602_9BACT|nr:hypothetical protein [Algoriphagus marincola]MBY5951767.1 hypothetical protein [Algoriphagus marincola]
MLEHPITAVFLIIGGTVGFTVVAVKHTNDHGSTDNITIRGYAATLGFIMIGSLILLNSSVLTAAITILFCSIGVLTFGVITKRIGTNSHLHKPQLLIFTILGIAASLAIFLANSNK